MIDSVRHLVFVYGTLRKGASNHHVLNGARCVAENAWIKGTLYDTGLGYPALSLSPHGKVHGEIFEVDDIGLQTLDQLEGFVADRESNLYERMVQKVTTRDGLLDTYIYTVDHNLSICQKCIPSGDWIQWVKRLENQDTSVSS
ncbi:gamma-glutamylcyclotransferase family protein [Pseudalkalibacillus sp. Hm43]|uniref:gamma-glutamylcyclotransferase family protein n=1 Tax=Pseudalkalibacillus sp. Hm43 TaxID=3450742 RepID=UPI003F427425